MKNDMDKKVTKVVSKKETAKKHTKTVSIVKIIKEKKIANARFVKRGSTKKDAPVLAVKNISKTFGDFKALDKVNFELKRGERIGLIGANGAGKTTVSEIIAGLSKPTSGTMTYGFKFDESPQEKIGMQFQQSEYPSGLTVKDMVKFAINLRKIKMSKKELNELLNIFQMQDFYNRKARSLSGGQRQKLNILMSIMHQPEIVILDELSTGLDIAAREDIIEFTDQLLTKRNMSAILISHHMQEIKALCDKVVILDHGKVKEIAMIKDIEKKHGSLHAYAKTLIHAGIAETQEVKLSSKQVRFNTKVNKKVKQFDFKIKKAKNLGKESKVKNIEAAKTRFEDKTKRIKAREEVKEKALKVKLDKKEKQLKSKLSKKAKAKAAKKASKAKKEVK